MKVVIDTNYFIDRELPQGNVTEAFIPSSVERELKDRHTEEYYQTYGFNITVRDPKEHYVSEVKEACRDKHYGISDADVDVVALMLELSDEINACWIGPDSMDGVEELFCLTKDNGIKAALTFFGLYEDPAFQSRKYRLRCFGCFTFYDKEVDFCRKCGYSTISRVSIVGEGPDERILFKKGFKYKERVLKDENGKVIRTEDQKEYLRMRDGRFRR